MRGHGRRGNTNHNCCLDPAVAFRRSDAATPIAVHVTPAHIRQAAERNKRRDYDPGADCPVAIAVDEVLHPVSSSKRRKFVYVTCDTVQWFHAKGVYREFVLPAEAKLFIQQCDKGESVKTFSFQLTEYQDRHIFPLGIRGFPRIDGQGNVSIWFESA